MKKRNILGIICVLVILLTHFLTASWCGAYKYPKLKQNKDKTILYYNGNAYVKCESHTNAIQNNGWDFWWLNFDMFDKIIGRVEGARYAPWDEVYSSTTGGDDFLCSSFRMWRKESVEFPCDTDLVIDKIKRFNVQDESDKNTDLLQEFFFKDARFKDVIDDETKTPLPTGVFPDRVFNNFNYYDIDIKVNFKECSLLNLRTTLYVIQDKVHLMLHYNSYQLKEEYAQKVLNYLIKKGVTIPT